MTYSIDAKEFQGSRVLVTGGTKGLGHAIYKRFLQGGARVVTTARTPIDSIAPEQFIQADLYSEAGCKTVIEETFRRLGGLDILINCMGGSETPGGGVMALTEQMWLDELSVNLLAPVRLDRGFIPHMLEQRKGVIIHVSSIQRKMPLFESTLAYAAAKAALTNYSKGLSKELTPKGIRVNSVAPGGIQTTSAVRMAERLAAGAGSADINEGWKIMMDSLGGVPMGRFALPEEVAELIAFIASERGAYLAGGEFIMDGGTIKTV
jgi:NAD(P)-dependent dehydrogenase (short-subunit alcohol dehydrogenase family)